MGCYGWNDRQSERGSKRLIMRILFIYLLPFLLPLAAYLAWAWYRATYVKEHDGNQPEIEKGPWPALLLIGALLAFGVMAATALMRGADSDATYTPPRYEDGRVTPGRLEEK